MLNYLTRRGKIVTYVTVGALAVGGTLYGIFRGGPEEQPEPTVATQPAEPAMPPEREEFVNRIKTEIERYIEETTGDADGFLRDADTAFSGHRARTRLEYRNAVEAAARDSGDYVGGQLDAARQAVEDGINPPADNGEE